MGVFGSHPSTYHSESCKDVMPTEQRPCHLWGGFLGIRRVERVGKLDNIPTSCSQTRNCSLVGCKAGPPPLLKFFQPLLLSPALGSVIASILVIHLHSFFFFFFFELESTSLVFNFPKAQLSIIIHMLNALWLIESHWMGWRWSWESVLLIYSLHDPCTHQFENHHCT